MKKTAKRRGPLTIGDVLKIHETYEKTPVTSSEVLGDSFFYHTSPLFKNVRDVFYKCGYQLTASPPFSYFSFPLISLTEILQTKKVPVLDNVSFVKKIEREKPGFFKLSEFSGLGGNYILHESSHCIAHHILGGPPTPGWTNKKSAEKEDIVKIMLAESFANSTELIFYNSIKKDRALGWLLGKSIYFSANSKNFNRIVAKVGLGATTKLTVLLFLYSNFLVVELGPKIDRQIFDFLGFDKKVTKDKEFLKGYNNLKKQTFTLNPNFRVFSTRLYLKRVGIETNLTRLLNFDPLLFIDKSEDLKQKLEDLVAVVDGTYLGQSKKETSLMKAA